ncbi:MAG: hypothetical protein ACUVQ1_03025 [Candidatus Kapaibacteriales bacterium]
MPIDKDFVNSLPNNPLIAETRIIEEFNKILAEANKTNNRENFYNDFLDIFSFYQVYAAKHSLNLLFPPLFNDKKINLGIIFNFFENRQKVLEEELEDFLSYKKIHQRKTIFESLLSNDVIYSLNDKELSSFYKKIDELIDLINENFYIRHSLKTRLINLLGLLKKELKPLMYNFDKFWSLVGYSGIIYGLYEENVLKIIDKIKDILNFIWKIVAKFESLPTTNPVITLVFKEIKSK